jgi:hypothetical protein
LFNSTLKDTVKARVVMYNGGIAHDWAILEVLDEERFACVDSMWVDTSDVSKSVNRVGYPCWMVDDCD